MVKNSCLLCIWCDNRESQCACSARHVVHTLLHSNGRHFEGIDGPAQYRDIMIRTGGIGFKVWAAYGAVGCMNSGQKKWCSIMPHILGEQERSHWLWLINHINSLSHSLPTSLLTAMSHSQQTQQMYYAATHGKRDAVKKRYTIFKNSRELEDTEGECHRWRDGDNLCTFPTHISPQRAIIILTNSRCKGATNR